MIPFNNESFHVKISEEGQRGGDVIGRGHLPISTAKLPIPRKINLDNLGIEVTAQSGVAIDWDSGKILWEKNSSQKMLIAKHWPSRRMLTPEGMWYNIAIVIRIPMKGDK